MAVDWNERRRQQELDERIYRAIKTRDWGTALMELFKEVRQVRICEHGNMTDYQPCPQCDAEFDEWMRAPEVEEE
jgi:hypothetical protein